MTQPGSLLVSFLSTDYRENSGVQSSGKNIPFFETYISNTEQFKELVSDVIYGEDRSIQNIALISMDALFSPYSTDYLNDGDFPAFEIPTRSGVEANSVYLNPFNPFNIMGTGQAASTGNVGPAWMASGHNIAMAAVGAGLGNPTGVNSNSGTKPNSFVFDTDFESRGKVEHLDVRGVGLRSPLVLTGWGFDTEGNPVPSGSGGNIHSEAFWNPATWKTGPVDLRWDDVRKVWTGGVEETARFKIEDNVIPSGSGIIYRTSNPSGLYASKLDSVDTISSTGNRIYADYVRSVFVKNDIVWCKRLNSKWQIKDDGTTQWIATANEDIVSGNYGDVSLYNGARGNSVASARIIDSTDSMSSGTTCVVNWMDGYQQFIISPVTCPTPIVEG